MSERFYSIDVSWYNLKEDDSLFVEGWLIEEDCEKPALTVRDQDGQELPFSVTWKERPDIAQARPELPARETPGFTLKISRVSDWLGGLSCLEIQAGEGTVLKQLSSSEIEKTVADSTILYEVDVLQLLETQLVVQGWCIDQQLRDEIVVTDSQGREIGCECYRTVREDARSKYDTYVEKNHEIGFTVKVPLEEIKTSKVLISFVSRMVSRTYTVDMAELRREQTKGGRLYNMLRPGKFRENMEYIKKHDVGSFIAHVKKSVSQEYSNYSLWVKSHRLTAEQVKAQRNHSFSYRPKISILIPLYHTPLPYLKELLNSIVTQSYENWELCLADGSTKDEVEHYIRRHYGKDSRIVYQRLKENKGISENTNAALAMATGDFIMLSDHDDIVEQGALFEIVKALNENPDLDILYTDEDKITMDGKAYFEPNFKTDFNPFLMECNNYICHIFVVRASIIKKIGGFRREYDGAQDFDLILRCWEETENSKIYHIPKVLYHWRSHPNSTATNPESKRYAYEAGARALDDHFARRGVEARAEITPNLGIYRIYRKVKGNPKISIIIPTKDHLEDLELCLSSVAAKTTYDNYEILVVENNSEQPETFAYYEKMVQTYKNCRLLRWESGFNYAAINNFAARQATGDYLLFLNNDVELITENWLQEMLSVCQQKEVAIVGAKLYYPDETIQHAGVILGLGGVAGHIFSGVSRYEPSYMGRAIMPQNLTAVTAACMMMKKAVFEEVGGFDEEFQVAFNDVDLCMKAGKAGYEVVFTPYAELYHYESKSRGMEDNQEKQNRFYGEVYRFESKWGDILEKGDPYYNPNLSLEDGNCNVREDT